jgi:hypothetical protein
MPTAVEKQRQGPVLTTDRGITATPILSFNLQHISPYDQQAGHTSGKCQHMPVVITKQWDASSPKLLAAVSCELLQKVTIKFEDDWLTFTNAKFLTFTHPGGNVESFTFEYGDVEVGREAAGRPVLSHMQLAWCCSSSGA